MNTNEKIGIAFITFIVIFLIAILSGTILWLIYPHIHALFPTAASKGIIAQKLSWWDSVCIVWIFNILIKGNPSPSSDKQNNKK
jgi:hypothetical protein